MTYFADWITEAAWRHFPAGSKTSFTAADVRQAGYSTNMSRKSRTFFSGSDMVISSLSTTYPETSCTGAHTGILLL